MSSANTHNPNKLDKKTRKKLSTMFTSDDVREMLFATDENADPKTKLRNRVSQMRMQRSGLHSLLHTIQQESKEREKPSVSIESIIHSAPIKKVRKKELISSETYVSFVESFRRYMHDHAIQSFDMIPENDMIDGENVRSIVYRIARYEMTPTDEIEL